MRWVLRQLICRFIPNVVRSTEAVRLLWALNGQLIAQRLLQGSDISSPDYKFTMGAGDYQPCCLGCRSQTYVLMREAFSDVQSGFAEAESGPECT